MLFSCDRLAPAEDRPGQEERAGFGRAKSVIFVFASGGQSQIDMWDPKPDAPTDIRGEFDTIDTAIAGARFCEHMPRIARIANRLTVVRSMSHEDLDHGSAVYLTLTGHYHPRRSSNPPPRADDMPTLGAILRRARPTDRFTHDAVHLNGPALVPTTVSPGQDGGLLGRGFEPLLVGDVRSSQGAIPGLTPIPGLSLSRLDHRLELKHEFDRLMQHLEHQPIATDTTRLYSQALHMLASPQVRSAFDLEQEPTSIRERYGRDRSGQACLLARRLVEAGVPFVNVIWNHSNRGQDLSPNDTDQYGWDTHNDIFDALRNRLLPRFDLSFSALIEDLDDRGLLDTTLVVCLGEFGRAPRVALEPKFAGSSPGRKHWSSVYSMVFAGGGVRRGTILGASDRIGADPTTDRYGPWDVAATIFHALGVDPSQPYVDGLGRRFTIADGRPMTDIF